jgi:RNA polymerase sigma factor (TIGR02999 family)
MAVNEVTRILAALDQGETQAASQLLPLVYDELRRLASHRLTQEKPGQTLTATALVHEAYLRLVGQKVHGESTETKWQGRGHFFAAAAEAMRRILVEQARRRKAQKHGGEMHRVELADIAVPANRPDEDLLALDAALDQLAAEDPIKAELVKLRYFAGLTVEQAASSLGISRATADRYWSYAKVWLFEAIQSESVEKE